MGVETQLPRGNRARKARLSIDQYYRICESGALDEFGRTELIGGEICVMNSQFMPHMRVKIALLFALAETLKSVRPDLEIGSEGAIELGPDNVPEPDVFIFENIGVQRGAPGSSVKLVIEVADATTRRDLGSKKRLYAEHGIPEYWVALVRSRKVERFCDPSAGDYSRRDSFDFGERIDSVTLPGVHIPAGLLG